MRHSNCVPLKTTPHHTFASQVVLLLKLVTRPRDSIQNSHSSLFFSLFEVFTYFNSPQHTMVGAAVGTLQDLLTGKPHSYLGRLVGSLCSACAGPLKCLTLLNSEPREGKLIKLGSGFLNSTSKWCESLLDLMSSLSDWGLQFSGAVAL
jgi:hypothetical protein